MRNNTIIGLDIAKTNFHLVKINVSGKLIAKKSLHRKKVLEYFANHEICTVALEACGGSNYWGRELVKLGHKVKIIPAMKVKPYLVKQKNDLNDAAAIAEAASRESVKWISPARVEQQDMQNILRVRQRLVKNTTALSNQIRGLLMEYGIVCKQGHSALLKLLPEIINDGENSERALWKLTFSDLYEQLLYSLDKIAQYNKIVKDAVKQNQQCQKVLALPGVGNLSALAIAASVTDIRNFDNSRQFAAWLGLVPRQHSTGGKTKLLGITKRGDKYTRTLLVHGGRVLTKNATKEKNPWLYHLKSRRGFNKAAVAQANKTARRVYAVLSSTN